MPTNPTPLPGVRAVTYDLWLTLLSDNDPEQTRDARARGLATTLSTSYDAALQLLVDASSALHAGWERGRAQTVDEIAEGLVRATGQEVGGELVAAVVVALEGVTTAATVALLPGAHDTLTALAAGGLELGLVCDTGMSGGGHLRHVLDELDVLDLFGVTVFSDEVGVPKPGLRPFTTALDALGVSPEQAVHVGDLRRRDVAGAVGAGMRAVRYRGARDDAFDAGPADAAHVLDDHRDLLALLGLT